jgi:Tol biopolymer transport system component
MMAGSPVPLTRSESASKMETVKFPERLFVWRIGPRMLLLALVVGFARTADAQLTERVSVDSDGRQAEGECTVQPNRTMSGDARFVVFGSLATNIVPDGGNNYPGIYLNDRMTRTTVRLSNGSSGVAAAGASWSPCISRNGRFVAFASTANDIVPNDFGGLDAFVFDLNGGTVVRVPLANAAAEVSSLDVSDDGRCVAVAQNLNGTPSTAFAYLYDVSNGSYTRLASKTSAVSLSGDGRFVAFSSAGSELPGNRTSQDLWNIFVYDRDTQSYERLTSNRGVANAGSNSPSISSDGRFVAFLTTMIDAAPGSSFGLPNTYVRDRLTGATTLVSHDLAGYPSVPPYGGATGSIGIPGGSVAISGDGRWVAFPSWGTILGESCANPASCAIALFLWDQTTQGVVRASLTVDGGPEDGRAPSISDDGSTVAFETSSPNVVCQDTNMANDVFVVNFHRDRFSAVEPPYGSATGGDLVRFDYAVEWGVRNLDTVVRFGPSVAQIVSSTPTSMIVRTPPGSGVVDVSVTTRCGVSTRSSAYTYVPPDVAARYGNVGAAGFRRETVLLANAVSGDVLTRELHVRAEEPLTIVMVSPTTPQTAPFVLYGWTGSPDASTLVDLPAGVGPMVFPAPFSGREPGPRAIWNNLRRFRVLGFPTLASRAAPSVIVRQPGGAPRRMSVTLQGLIVDGAARTAAGVSVTNAILLRVD